jgi:arylformamidase
MANIYRHIADRATLEREYSPSSCVADVREFTDAYRVRSEAARRQLSAHRTVQYGTAAAEALDFFSAPVTPSGPPRPVLAYIHGGYWQELSKNDHSFPAVAATRHRLNYAAVGYGLAPDASLDDMVERCRQAIAWIATHCAELAVERNAIHVAGSSAGAHLAAMVGLTDWSLYGLDASPVRSLTLLSGVFDLRPLLLTYINDAVGMSEAQALRNSPALLIDGAQATFPPALLAYGANETAEFKRQSCEFATAIVRKGYVALVREIAGRNHFDLPFDLLDETTTLGQLMAGQLRLEAVE